MQPTSARDDDDGTLSTRRVRASRTGLRARACSSPCLTAVAAQVSVPLPFTPVPFTLQPMVVLARRRRRSARGSACASQMLYLALGIAGLPVFAASPVLPQGAARLLGRPAAT